MINNLFIAGAQSFATRGCVFPADAEKGTRVYVAGNVSPLTPTGTEDPWLNVTSYISSGGKSIAQQPANLAYKAAIPFPAAAIATVPAQQACDLVLARAGAAVRDADDLRVINRVINPLIEYLPE